MISMRGWPLWLRTGSAALLGVIAALGLAPNGLWFATIAAILPLPALALSSPSRGHAIWAGWAFAAGYFGHGWFWIIEPFLVDPERHAWMAPFAVLLLAGGMALYWAVAFFAAFTLGRTDRHRIVLLALFLSLAELVRGYAFTGFPWASLAQIWVDTPVAALLAWIGPSGLTTATFLIALLPGYALWARRGVMPVILSCLPAAGFACLSFAAAAWQPDIRFTGKTVRLVQPNAPQHQKWDPAHFPTFLARQLNFTAHQPVPDLTVWPETSVPYWLHEADEVMTATSDAAGKTPVVFGINRTDGQRIYNSLVVLGANAAPIDVYDKSHLVPFGEFVPFGDILARVGLKGFAANRGQGFSAGSGPRLLDVPGIGQALPLICYEAVFPQDVNAVTDRPDLLLQITNDAWFGTRSGPYQHLVQAQMRAIEQGVPLIRAANTGISAVIGPTGQITERIPLGEAGFVDADLPAANAPTVYSQTGDLPLLLILLVLTTVTWIRRPQKTLSLSD